MLVAATLAATAVALAVSSSGTGDYAVHGAVGGDNAGPAIAALSHGDVCAFIAQQPLMGLTSLLLRVPLVMLAAPLGNGNKLAYGIGAAACLLPAALLGVWMFAARTHRAGWFPPAIAFLILMGSPVVRDALGAGHPEEMLASALATGAVIAAIRQRVISAALLLGLAIGTKQWAVIAAIPAVVALERGRVRAAGAGTVLAVGLSATAPLADVAAFARASRAVGGGHTANVASLWWPLSSTLHIPIATHVAPTARRLPLGLTRSEALLFALLLLAAVLVAIVGSCRRRRLRRVDPLALLALLGLVRCITDPGDLNYYFVAALVPLTAWEVINLKRVPIAALALVAAVTLVFDSSAAFAPAIRNGLVIAWGVALGGYLLRGAFSARPVRRPALHIDVGAQAQMLPLR